MGTAIPRMPAMLGSFALQNTTFEIANDLRLARERAVATNGKGRIVFASDTYQLRRETSPGNYVDDGAVRSLPSNTSVTSAPVDPTFDSRGLVAAPYTITVANGYSTKTITVTAIGRVVVD
jgi:Tfp pilus assembly protein FimT